MNSESTMNEVLRPDERLATIAWPSPVETSSPFLTQNDCLVVCGGFEDRSIGLLSTTCRRAGGRFSLVIIEYLPRQDANRIDDARIIAKAAGINTTEFCYDRENPAGIGENVVRYAQRFDRIYVDISGMSRLLIVQMLVGMIRQRCRNATILYSQAERYFPSREEFRRDSGATDGSSKSYLSSGIFDIAATPELGSVAMLGAEVRLISFPSFDPDQLTNLVQELQPTYADFVFGKSTLPENGWRAEAIRTLNEHTTKEITNVGQYFTPTLDYRDTLRLLLRIYGNRCMFDRILVAPTGSKMQSLAVGLFRGALSDIQVVYPTPQKFSGPERYTQGVGTMYRVDLPMAEIGEAIWE